MYEKHGIWTEHAVNNSHLGENHVADKRANILSSYSKMHLMTRPCSSPSFPFGQPVLWEPVPAWIQQSNLQRFMERHGISDYDTLFQRSIEDIAWFWEAVLEDLDIRFYEPYTHIVDLSQGPAFPRWCVGGKMNIVHNCVDKWQETPVQHRIALRYESEEGHVRTLTYGQLYEEVNRCAHALRMRGIGKGDTVGLFMPMVPELCIAFLAVAKIGAILLPLFSGYGPEAVATRLKDGEARALFVSDGFYRRGRAIRMKEVADAALAHVPSVEHVIVHQRLDDPSISLTPERDILWDTFIHEHPLPDEVPTEVTDAEDVLMLIYTSGTTGRPKGAVHTHCGFPIKAAQDMFHPMDVKPGDVMYWMTDMGWMMGPWEVFGTLLIGATMVFYDGAPDYPDVDRIWSLVERHGVTHLGVSPTLIRALKPHGTEPLRRHDLSTLRAIGSTGSPWDPESWCWTFYEVLEGKKPILNYSGGTEISGGILCGNFFKPLKACAFSGPVPGMDADVVDEEGMPVRQQVGELIIRKPWIGMTRGFWNDPERYLETYWKRFPGVWTHGDFAAIDEDGLWYILGRSDDTLKIAGKRVGPAEVEAIVNAHPDVVESAAIGVPDPVKGEALVIFAVLQPGVEPSEILRKELQEKVTLALGKPLAPREVRFVRALPKTRNAKIMRRLIRAVYLNEPPGDTSSLEDPSTLEAIRQSS